MILNEIVEAFLKALVDYANGATIPKLKSDSVRNSLKQAFGLSIQRYASGHLCLGLTRPLLAKDGFLTLSIVAEELIQLVCFERNPDAELVGRQWKARLDNPPLWCDFTHETQCLLEYFQIELRRTESFHTVFSTKQLDAIATSMVASIEPLVQVEAQLADLAQLIDTPFGDLIQTFGKASINLREQIHDYTLFLNEKTRNFVGRQFVFDAVTHFTQIQPRGYFIIRGDPGIGKSAIAAQMVRAHGYAHHFNIRSEGINTTDSFLRNICTQLIVAYQLNHFSLPPEATQDGGFLTRLLEEVSDTLKADEKAIIVVDALDEVDSISLSPEVNTLFLPVTLPQGIYIVITTRKTFVHLHIECEENDLDIDHASVGNIADVREYVTRAIMRPSIQTFIAAQGIGNELFIEFLMEISNGNFMYLRYIFPAIADGKYGYQKLKDLPISLQGYYEQHWRLMQGADEEAWFRYKLPILIVLAVTEEPISIDLIEKFSGVYERNRIIDTLNGWGQFLEISPGKRYNLYHASFRDFLATKDEIEEGVSTRLAKLQIADALFPDDLWSE